MSTTVESWYQIVENRLTLREAGHEDVASPADPMLQQYYNHVHELFQKRFAEFNQMQKPTEAQRKKVVALFTEMMRVKAILIGEDEGTWGKLC